MRRLCILTIAIVTPPIAYGQSLGRPERLPTIYREAVLAYQRGDVDKAADAVVMWLPEYSRRAISALVDDHDERLSESAVMLHTEIVLRGKATTKAAVSLLTERYVLQPDRPVTPAHQPDRSDQDQDRLQHVPIVSCIDSSDQLVRTAITFWRRTGRNQPAPLGRGEEHRHVRKKQQIEEMGRAPQSGKSSVTAAPS